MVLATMCCSYGSTQVMVGGFDPLVTLASIHRERCTVLHGVPTMFISMLHHPMFPMFDSLAPHRHHGGSTLPEELMRQVNEQMFMDLTSVYGMTETSPA